MQNIVFVLTDDEKRELNQMVSSGKRNARQVLDALILLNCDESEGKKQSDEIIGGFLKVGKLRVHRVRKRFFENGMSGVFNLPHGGGRSKQIDGDFEAHLIALSCRDRQRGIHSGVCACWLIKWWNWNMLNPYRMKQCGRL